MKEFIVWYRNSKTNELFSEEFTLNDLVSQSHLDVISDSPNMRDYHILCINESVRKQDVEGNTIYANCSIVEFEYKYFNGRKEITQGYLSYCIEHLAYAIENLNPKNETKIIYWKHFMEDFKIIDTIQENKLGLIK